MSKPEKGENEEEVLEECLECGCLYPRDELVDGICSDCRESSGEYHCEYCGVEVAENEYEATGGLCFACASEFDEEDYETS